MQQNSKNENTITRIPPENPSEKKQINFTLMHDEIKKIDDIKNWMEQIGFCNSLTPSKVVGYSIRKIHALFKELLENSDIKSHSVDIEYSYFNHLVSIALKEKSNKPLNL